MLMLIAGGIDLTVDLGSHHCQLCLDLHHPDMLLHLKLVADSKSDHEGDSEHPQADQISWQLAQWSFV
jgi:hypothetical protein